MQKQGVVGIDLIDINETNLVDLGITTIHERKTVMRAIQGLKSSPFTEYGQINVKLFDA